VAYHKQETAEHEKDFEPAGFFVLRTPLLPMAEFLAWSEGLNAAASLDDPELFDQAYATDCARLRERLRSIVTRAEVRDALFIASPNIIERLHLWTADPDSERGRKIEQVLVRYFSRMTGRATPFGLFAGVSTGVIGDETNLGIGRRAGYRRHSRLDMDYLYALVDHITRDPVLRRDLKFYPNSSLYNAAGRVRYVESRIKEKDRSYHLVAVDETNYLAATIERATAGATPDALATALTDDEISLDEAREYVAELIESQILAPEIALNVSGPEAVHPLIEKLSKSKETIEIANHLRRACEDLESIDRDGPGVDPDRYQRIARALDGLPTKVELSRLFQVDMAKPAPDVALGPDVLREIKRWVVIAHSVSAPQHEDDLTKFRDAFSKRYEDREVPLVEALDEEIGVGFGSSEENSPLIRELIFPPAIEEGRIDIDRQAFMLRKLSEAIGASLREINIEATEMEQIKTKQPLPLPDSFSIEAIVAAQTPSALANGDFRVLIGAAGPSGGALLGRFCHFDEGLREKVLILLRKEEAQDAAAIFAEIVHLPEGRLGNVIHRPRMREYEIPFLAHSTLDDEHQIPVTDLCVSVRNNRVRLRSLRLRREVIPRMTNAHNFSWRSLGLYRFLCRLQHQGSAILPGWDWSALVAAPFLPRVRSGRLVLSPARWRLEKEELSELAKTTGAARFRAVQSLRGRLGLPRLIALADGDNRLPVDLDNALSVDSFVQLIKGREAATLSELFPGPDELCVSGPEGLFVHELIVPFLSKTPAAADGYRLDSGRESTEFDSALPQAVLTRTFPPGSEWLFAKLYCGSATADVLLRELVREIVDGVTAAGAADRWFFIRYGDPDWHLRLRFQGSPQALQQKVLAIIHEKLTPFMQRGQIWRVQFDTYQREVERYGGVQGIELAEQVFHADSEAVLQLIETLEPGDAGADERWRLTFYGIDRLLDDFGFDLRARHLILKQTRDALAREFRVEKNLWSQLSDKFRKERKELASLLAASPNSDHPLALGLEILHQRSRNLSGIVQELQSRERAGDLSVALTSLMPSYIHMHANRLLRSAQRQQELVIYDLLTRLYESELKRER
jgi:thiopeptide-type bacteriocin biosynthesis protein